ncbi:MAG: hypothetical protein A2Z90_14190 [Burkholderiales bacterium GWA2_64_37]|nr:MAG: hypothetical protein A2Z90_14190 [Burkholderiales bacterium GWA2_64_37]
MRQVILNEADDRDLDASVLARELFERGLARLEERLWDESSASVFADFARSYEHFKSDENKQWSLRVPRKLFIRGQLVAKEYEISQSQLACWCLAMGLELELEVVA